MLVQRKGFELAYITFNGNGDIKLNKKKIGTWNRSADKSHNRMLYHATMENQGMIISERSKKDLIAKVAENIPQRMLRRNKAS